MMRYTLAGYATLGTRQSRVVEVAGESATVGATRTFAAADRIAEVEAPFGGLAGCTGIPGRSSVVPGSWMRRFGLSRFSCPGTLQSRHMAVEGQRVPLSRRGILSSPPLAMPRSTFLADIWARDRMRCRRLRRVSVAFEEVYPI